MDLYLINGKDGISLPEMIDWDIKLCDADISEEVGLNNFTELGYDLPPLDIEEEPNPLWTQSYSANSNSSFELDILGEVGASTLMVNPSSVMPFVSSHRGVISSRKVEEKDAYQMQDGEQNKQDIEPGKTEQKCSNESAITVEAVVEEEVREDIEKIETNINIQKLCEGKIIASQDLEIMPVPMEYVNVPDGNFIEITPTKKIPPVKRQVITFSEDAVTKLYPKPAYSYSCLIAMALKNSQTGSLPVSEIYSFMCHHFPYFKTAPSGWKNSVRHNLSLNKCFEKIEKPPGSGTSGSQRKGCLWAMNPAKITKMDEEVAKWSRKDPSAIKKAMIFPDNLELLERGELKDEAAFDEEEIEEEDTEEIKEGEIEDDFGLDVEDERISPIDDDSEDEMSRVPPSLQPFEPKFAHVNRQKILKKSRNQSEKSIDFSRDNMDFEVDNIYDELEVSDTRTLLGLDDSTPIYAVDPSDENMLIELPTVKKPRVQGNYIYQPMLNVKRHNINGLRSIKIQSP